MSEPGFPLRRISMTVAALLVLIAVIRVWVSYSHTAQTFDEPYHVAAAVELVDRGTYTLDPLHPPLERIAIGIPLYLGGERFPKVAVEDSDSSGTPYLCAVGNAILNDAGRYARNLKLARLGVLPFLLLACGVVFLWARREYGDFAAAAALGLFTTLPIVLEFSGIAYTDMVAAATQAASFWAFAEWLEKKNWRSAVWLGVAAGLALASKFTTFIYLPAAASSMWALRWWMLRTGPRQERALGKTLRQVLAAGAIAIALLWGSYGFETGRVRESMQISTASIPSFQHFPGPVAKMARTIILADPRIPGPALIRGVAMAWVKEKTEPTGYLLGHIKAGGWWYFFLVGVAVKAPVPFLILFVFGLVSLIQPARQRRWSALAPAACALAILAVTLPVKINYGMRHVLVVFPLLAMVAGSGCTYLWNLRWRGGLAGRIALVALLLWEGISTIRAGSDFTAYFNELAGSDPSKVLVAGCDLDCGQDLFALARELRERNVSHANLALWTSADMSKMGLPEFEVPQPYQPVTGWFAISLRALREGDLFHRSYPPDAFAWVKRYQPVARVGKTILLYYIPGSAGAN